jgi:Protein of unknown function (DUF3800)
VNVTFYGDESGTHKDAPFMLLAGHAATLGKWNAFGVEWNRALKPLGLAHFHATDHWGTNIGERFGPKIAKLTKKHLLFGCVIRLNKDDYERYYIGGTRPNKPQLDTMYGVSFRFLVTFLLTRLPALLGRSDVTFDIVLEAGARGSKDVYRITSDLKKQLPKETTMFGGVTLQEKRRFPGLQAADALAFGAYHVEPTNPHLIDGPEDQTIMQANRAVLVKPPIFRCELDERTFSALKTDILAMVEMRKRYAESLKSNRGNPTKLMNPQPAHR